MNYLIQLSNKTEIEIDREDLEKFYQNSASGNLIKLKHGIVNPAFVVSIIPSGAKGKKKIEGHIDQLTGNYVIDRESYEPFKLTDEFNETRNLIGKGGI